MEEGEEENEIMYVQKAYCVIFMLFYNAHCTCIIWWVKFSEWKSTVEVVVVAKYVKDPKHFFYLFELNCSA